MQFHTGLQKIRQNKTTESQKDQMYCLCTSLNCRLPTASQSGYLASLRVSQVNRYHTPNWCNSVATRLDMDGKLAPASVHAILLVHFGGTKTCRPRNNPFSSANQASQSYNSGEVEELFICTLAAKPYRNDWPWLVCTRTDNKVYSWPKLHRQEEPRSSFPIFKAVNW